MLGSLLIIVVGFAGYAYITERMMDRYEKISWDIARYHEPDKGNLPKGKLVRIK